MISTYALALIVIVAWWIYSNVSGLLKNIAAAKRSGLPWYIVPVNAYGIFWILTNKLWLPVLNRLPEAWTKNWLVFVTPDWVWKYLYGAIKPKGDIFLTVSPGTIHVWVTNAEAIQQITTRREAFPKQVQSYKILEIFGRNILSTEGSDWKLHRKITSPSFNEKNNVLIFAEATRQTEGMLKGWMGPEGRRNTTLDTVPHDTERLTLHIISHVGFGVRLLWPGEESSDKDVGIYSGTTPPKGHTMSFGNAISTLMENIFLVLLVPGWLLKRIPTQSAHAAYESYINWRNYMHELFDQKVEETRQGHKTEGMDILGNLVKSSYRDTIRAEKNGRPILSDSDILGNAFVMIVAGHETTANAIHFSMMELAMSPKSQRLVQNEVQSIFGDEPPEKWNYDSSINALLGGMVGAVMNEQLRLMAPITALPKCVTKEQDQVLTVDGKKMTLPAGAKIFLNTVGVHRNPRYWPTQPSKLSDKADDLDDFKPERWLVKVESNGENGVAAEEAKDEFGGFTGEDSHVKLFRPVKGSYIPFSEGPRSCLGRRLAQVKVMASLAVIFQKYSIELAVDEWASDDQVSKMSDEEKCTVYDKAQEAARIKMRGSTSLITLKLHPGFIPVRVVKKGEERFINHIDN